MLVKKGFQVFFQFISILKGLPIIIFPAEVNSAKRRLLPTHLTTPVKVELVRFARYGFFKLLVAVESS